MNRREYEPAGVVHVADCDLAPDERSYILRAAALRNSHDRPHTCFTRAHAAANAEIVIERIDYEKHPYIQSTIFPDDAVRPLCRTCRGTHRHNPPRELVAPRSPAALVLPGEGTA